MYLGSADWMERNLYRRIEVVFPIIKKSMRREIYKLLELQLADNVKAVEIDSDLKNVPVKNSGPKVRAQFDFADWLEEAYKEKN